jgi:hypothetical protein
VVKPNERVVRCIWVKFKLGDLNVDKCSELKLMFTNRVSIIIKIYIDLMKFAVYVVVRCIIIFHTVLFLVCVIVCMVVCFVCFCRIFTLCIFIVMFMYSFCYVRCVTGFLFRCVVLCIVRA